MKSLFIAASAFLLAGCEPPLVQSHNKGDWHIVHHYGQYSFSGDSYWADNISLHENGVSFYQPDGTLIWLYGSITVTKEANR